MAFTFTSDADAAQSLLLSRPNVAVVLIQKYAMPRRLREDARAAPSAPR